MQLILTASLLTGLARLAVAKQAACDSKSIQKPTRFGLEVTSIEAKEVRSYDYSANPTLPLFELPLDKKPIDFCNVTITYTHPGTDDSINVYIWLPLENWNKRYLGQGGGAFYSTFPDANAAGVANGYASASTDSGHTIWDESAESWALKSPGNVDMQALRNWGSTAVGELPVIAKQIIEGFYGVKPEYSYFTGCSAGGRQGLTIAQQYPEEYDGILASAPAIGWSEWGVTMNWARIHAPMEGYVPPPCELEAIYEAVIEACDELDGVKDHVISARNLCKFDISKTLGRPACGNKVVSEKAIRILKTAYEGPQRGSVWTQPAMGLTMLPASTNEILGKYGGQLQSECGENHENCDMVTFLASGDWAKYFVRAQPDLDLLSLTEDDVFETLRISKQQFASTINADAADLTEFGRAGGKMITWHGLADQLLNPNYTSSYYDRVLAVDPNAPDYYRYFEAPGILHCAYGGDGFFPSSTWKSLVDWVENGKAPDQLLGKTPYVEESKVNTRPLCPYPQVAQYIGGNPKEAGSYKCAKDFGKKKASYGVDEHSEL